MRLLATTTAVSLLMLQMAPGFAQTPPPPAANAPAPATMPAPAPAPAAPGAATSPTTPPETMSPATPGTTSPASKPMRHKRMTMAQRFKAANTAGDGHLTQDQATAAKWPYVTRHFDAIDKDHKGYVTMDDIRAYSKANRVARHRSPTPAPATGEAPTPGPAPAPTPAPAPAPAPAAPPSGTSN